MNYKKKLPNFLINCSIHFVAIHDKRNSGFQNDKIVFVHA